MADVEINGVGYDLAEDGEGRHYIASWEPLRPPNAVSVQGDDPGTFQLRPDVLLWSLTDWSGGEGHQKYSEQARNRHRLLTGVRVFDTPGTLRPGFYWEETKDSADLNVDHADALKLVVSDNLRGVSSVTNEIIYGWEVAGWFSSTNVSTVLGAGGAGSGVKVAGDDSTFWFVETATNDLFKSNGTLGGTALLNGTDLTLGQVSIEQLGAYVYAADVVTGEVWEFLKSTGVGTLVYDISDDPGNSGSVWSTVMDGKLYIAVQHENGTTAVHEIVPSSAAGTGYGYEITRIPGFKARSLWSHSGVLYLSGKISTESAIMYVIPGQSFGTLGRVRAGENVGNTHGQGSSSGMLEHYFAVDQLSATNQVHAMFQIDAVSGGMACISYDEDGDDVDALLDYPVVFEGTPYVSNVNGSTAERVYRLRADQYMKSSEAISPWNDYGIADQKILSSLVLATEAIPTDWTVYVDYATNNDDTWTNVITSTTAGVTRTAVSTDSSTVKFGTLSIRIRMVYAGAGVPASCPVVLGVDAFAMVARPTRVWRLLLDLSDSKGGSDKGRRGNRKRTLLETAVNTESVVRFRDFYGSHVPGSIEDDVDVIIDRLDINLNSDGEGVAEVTLKETV